MTTTLRPAGPEKHGPGGALTRDFTVCTRGGPTGTVRLETDERLGPSTGRITSLAIDSPYRRRGRGTIAALIAEEVLRSWGCRAVLARIPATAPAAFRVAAALGYREHGRTLAKRLTESPPPARPGIALRPMDADDFAGWSPRALAHWAARYRRDGLPADQAERLAAATHARLLPDGHRTQDTALRVMAAPAPGADVGWLWLGTGTPEDPERRSWVHLVETGEAYRRQGYGRQLMLAAERESLAAGVPEIGLQVFGDNPGALRLYETLDYQAVSFEMAKALL